MLIQSIRMAWKAINSNKMRAFLTMLGIIIGVVALVVLVSMVSSASDTITSEVESLGSNMLMLSIMDDKENPLGLSDVDSIAELDEVDEATAVAQTMLTAKNGYTETMVIAYGTTASYFNIQSMVVDNGRTLRTADVDNASYVCVLSYEAADKLFGTTEATGETVTIGGRQFMVAGVLEKSDSLMTSFMTSSSVYLPYTVMQRMSAGVSGVTTIYASAANDDTDAAEDAIDDWMKTRMRGDDESYMLMSMASIAGAMDTINNLMTLLLGGIAAISLLVGGIGIMNIMLVSVTERTREIGIRKAIGATRGSIMLQFLIEALMLSLMGCMIGVLLSWLIIGVISLIAGSSITFTMATSVVLIAVSFAIAIGVIFGIYPAYKAAWKPPIEALRFEG